MTVDDEVPVTILLVHVASLLPAVSQVPAPRINEGRINEVTARHRPPCAIRDFTLDPAMGALATLE
jgi:hypothetical protein